jgi:hypothetical protein
MDRTQLYRKGSLERIQSPEQLNDYLRVTHPSVWVLLTAVILLLAGLLVWGSMAYIDSVAYGKAEVTQGSMLVRFDEERAAEHVDVGMSVTVGETRSEIRSMGWDEQGMFALAETTLADGEYDAAVHYKQTQVLKLLFR